MKLRRILLALFCLTCVTLTSCANDDGGGYAGNPTYDNLSGMQQDHLSDIEASGIQVIKQGAKMTFAIPTDTFFTKSTRAVKEGHSDDLVRLAVFVHDYLRYFSDGKVSVTGYTDKVWNAPARNKLSLHYAQLVANFMREAGVPDDVLTIRGKGAKHPIASNQYPMGASFNRRVMVIIH
ncbi:MAG TPA: OmpA family protein [Coxiellaceae bacterium]|nr:OmpA family protein [Coxiellaceae bacterium]